MLAFTITTFLALKYASTDQHRIGRDPLLLHTDGELSSLGGDVSTEP